MAAGVGISGLLGGVSAVLFLYVLIEAAIDEVLWVYLAAIFGIVVGGLCFRIVIWAGRGQSR